MTEGILLNNGLFNLLFVVYSLYVAFRLIKLGLIKRIMRQRKADAIRKLDPKSSMFQKWENKKGKWKNRIEGDD